MRWSIPHYCVTFDQMVTVELRHHRCRRQRWELRRLPTTGSWASRSEFPTAGQRRCREVGSTSRLYPSAQRVTVLPLSATHGPQKGNVPPPCRPLPQTGSYASARGPHGATMRCVGSGLVLGGVTAARGTLRRSVAGRAQRPPGGAVVVRRRWLLPRPALGRRFGRLWRPFRVRVLSGRAVRLEVPGWVLKLSRHTGRSHLGGTCQKPPGDSQPHVDGLN